MTGHLLRGNIMVEGNGKRLVALALAIVAASLLAKFGIHHGGAGTLNFAW